MQVTATLLIRFQAYTGVSARATMEFDAGVPVQDNLTTLASDPWISMYPG